MGNTRDIRLREDQKKLEKLAENCHYLTVKPLKGKPPVEYMLTFALRGYIDKKGNTRDIHRVRMVLPSGYPFNTPPAFTFTEKLYHPHVFDNGYACIGFHGREWNPGFRIDELVIDVAKFICFKKDSFRKPLGFFYSRWIKSHPIPSDNTNLLPVEKPVVKIKKSKVQAGDVKIKGGTAPLPAKPLPIKIKIK
jgi:ubiquitin-protein ligase